LPYPDDDRLVLSYVEAPNLAGRRAGYTGAEAAEALTGTPGFNATPNYGANELPRPGICVAVHARYSPWSGSTMQVVA
jgi:hypothetical protein